MLAQARQILSKLTDSPPDVFTVTISAPDQVNITFRSEPGEFAGEDESPDGRADLPPLERAILHAATRSPAPAKALARKAGKRLNSRFYQALRALQAKDPPLLIKVAGGFRLP